MPDKENIQKLKEKAQPAEKEGFSVRHTQAYHDSYNEADGTMLKDYIVEGKDNIKLSFEHIRDSRDYPEKRRIILDVNGEELAELKLKKGTFQKHGEEKPTCDFDKMADILLDIEDCLKKGITKGKYIEEATYTDDETRNRVSKNDNPKALEAIKETMNKYIFNTSEHREILAEKRQKREEQARISMMISQTRSGHTK